MPFIQNKINNSDILYTGLYMTSEYLLQSQVKIVFQDDF